ncbi:response regulator [Cocleimonas flava]|jgi:DNA-binding NarL/FixJ family response regulator|uniref:LuxR family two component transcriptional regulator n=1 Tax=Cocleimonas flava TaxID=634765 RepID=A0A4R1F8R7_9GAMM|nr:MULTISPECIES: DNA-binding response regulator [Cocleimonas]MEB8431420.1 DNA-binding response regulator [Cocleimonas sp. KMM 6892]MEC4713808.1 DNA-binding response regulator [Cocleimonas sp. KMM 6895]MEC4743139.1 DNA-binding response regulator [Cocleimonas sp. KMM 6896]TCJ89099.1 LuxR family two component transcriptional regulator [Cocleimonas flava]
MIEKETKGIVLVADDSAEALGMINEALINEGYTVLVAMNGEQAISIANRMVPDIILMDIIMPIMDGVEACKELKKNSDLTDIPVIFMTGLSDKDYLFQSLDAGGVDYINKPVQFDELLARIKVHLRNSKSTRSAHKALNQIGQLAFTCDANAKIIWATNTAQKLLESAGINTEENSELMSEQIRFWLSSNPEKHGSLWLKDFDKPIQVCFLGRPAPGEYLLRLTNDDEISTRELFCERFSVTERESEVLFWLVRGKTNREIGQILSMSPRTVNKHLEPIFRKLGVENRTSATAVCLRFLSHH